MPHPCLWVQPESATSFLLNARTILGARFGFSCHLAKIQNAVHFSTLLAITGCIYPHTKVGYLAIDVDETVVSYVQCRYSKKVDLSLPRGKSDTQLLNKVSFNYNQGHGSIPWAQGHTHRAGRTLRFSIYSFTILELP